eukprot:m.1431041 g.1431041  ORF g.1431041 m.1431041 type:complete len:301 (+) comp25075_c0_seq16:264-1166(+)
MACTACTNAETGASLTAPAQDAATCCGFTDVAHSPTCSVYGRRFGVCKCDGGATARENATLFCPPGGQCSREYMLAMVAALDDAVGNVTRALHDRAMYNNTLIVFTSDNGGAVAGHPQFGAMNNHPFRGGKSAYFEGGMRTAAFVSGGFLPSTSRGTTSAVFMSIADWYNTFLSLSSPLSLSPSPSPDHATGSTDRQRRGAIPAPYGRLTVPLDSLNVWEAVVHGGTGPRASLLFGALVGGAVMTADGYKLIRGAQIPSNWYSCAAICHRAHCRFHGRLSGAMYTHPRQEPRSTPHNTDV